MLRARPEVACRIGQAASPSEKPRAHILPQVSDAVKQYLTNALTELTNVSSIAMMLIGS
jgi:hypothetical protein